jgi:hypothetical protein
MTELSFMVTRIAAAVLFIFFAHAYAHSQSVLADREYDVILAVVGSNDFVIKDRTRVDQTWSTTNWKYISETFKGLSRSAFDNYTETNKNPAAVEKKFRTDKNYSLISDSELKNRFRPRGNLRQEWEDFKKAYPAASGYYYETSRPGFSTDGKQALIFVSFYCGSLCADGSWYFLELTDGKWKLTLRKGVWAS